MNDKVWETVGRASDAVTVRRVYGDAYEKDGLTVIPAATVIGGGGGGTGERPEGEGLGIGAGTGFGLVAWPSGAFVIRDGEVRWQPALDLNRIGIGLFLLILSRSVFRRRKKR